MRIFITAVMLLFMQTSIAQDTASYTSNELVYSRKDGMALTMIRLTPTEKPNGRGIISLVSGNWISNYSVAPGYIKRANVLIKAGYTVFMVFHSSQPRYAIPDAVEDVRRAIRFVRYNAASYGIDPNHIGITGSSSGGHLSLMAALMDDEAVQDIKDPVDRVSSRVQAVAVFYPPVDFLNWGVGNPELQKQIMIRTRVIGAFDFKRFNDSTGLYESVKDDEAVKKIAAKYSPITAVSKDDPPVMIAHGDADFVVPLQQSQSLIQKLTEAGVPNELIIHPKGGHGWKSMEIEVQRFVSWFDKYLR